MNKEIKEDNELSKSFWYVFGGFSLIIIIIVAMGFFIFSKKDKKVVEEKKHGGNVTLNYSSNVKGLSIINALPTTDVLGAVSDLDGQYFDFSIKVDLDKAKNVEYEISAKKIIKDSTISDEDIRIYLEKEESGTYTKILAPSNFKATNKESAIGTPKGNMVLTKVKKNKSSVENYRLRMWLSENSLMQNGNYSVEIDVVGKAK